MNDLFSNDLFGHPVEEEAPLPLKSGEVMSEVAPGQFAAHVEVWDLPSYVLSKYVPIGDGNYRLEVVDEWAGFIPVGDIRKKLGIKGMSEQTVRRLCIAGMVEYCQPTPQSYLIKIDSLVAHMERTKNTHTRVEPYWSSQRRQLWKTTCGF